MSAEPSSNGSELLNDLNQFTETLELLKKNPALSKDPSFLKKVSLTILSLNKHSKLGVSDVSGKF